MYFCLEVKPASQKMLRAKNPAEPLRIIKGKIP